MSMFQNDPFDAASHYRSCGCGQHVSQTEHDAPSTVSTDSLVDRTQRAITSLAKTKRLRSTPPCLSASISASRTRGITMAAIFIRRWKKTLLTVRRGWVRTTMKSLASTRS